MGQISFTKRLCTQYPFKMLSNIPRKLCLVLSALVLGQAIKAQTSGNQTSAYDTALTSDGFGVYHLHIPRFNPDSGTLVSVRISALTNTLYGFTLRNADSLTATYALTVGLQDEFSGPALPATWSNVTSQPMGSFPLSAGQSMTQTPVHLLQNHVSTDTINSITSFLGTGAVDLQYQAFTFTNLNASNNAAYYYSAGITNNMTFTVEYVFARASGILSAALTGWSALPIGPHNVQLSWAATDETAGRQYVIQRGRNDNSFVNIATLSATADGSTAQYRYPDELPATIDNPADNSWHYRLQIQDASGQITYSPVRTVKLDGNTAKGLQVYPNPATSFINLVPDQQEATDWQVDILAANGSVIQREVFSQSTIMTVNFRNRMAAGTYFVRATDTRGQRSLSTSFLIPETR
jgi:Secretion system C-terminal sorting domain